MNRTPLIIFLWMATGTLIWPCDCAEPRPACAYVGADAIFLGRVSFTNDDGSGTFLQDTLVRFDVEEIFKGIPAGTKEVWADPGSFTTCYEEYHLGERYLIVAQRKSQLPTDSAAMSVSRRKGGRMKPFPPEIDPAKPPMIYWAPECSGSRPVDRFPHIERDYAMLRAYRDGRALPRVIGYVYLTPFRAWPELDGPQLKGVHITLNGSAGTLQTTTDADGTFTLADAPAGIYTLGAQLPPFVQVQPRPMLRVPEVGCGFRDAALRTTSKIEGIVLDHDGHAAPRIPVFVDVLNTLHSRYIATLRTKTDSEGRFAIVGIPDADIRLSYGSPAPSSRHDPYRLVYYPNATSEAKAGTLRLRIGEQRTGIVLRLPVAPKIDRVNVKLIFPDGSPVYGASVTGNLGGSNTEFANTGDGNTAELSCLEGLQYQLKAHVSLGPTFRSGVMRNQPVRMVCGKNRGPFTLILDHHERF